MLLVNRQLVIDNDGAHAATERTATLELEEGTHTFDVVYFERDGEQQLALDWSGPETSGERRALSTATETMGNCPPPAEAAAGVPQRPDTSVSPHGFDTGSAEP